MAAAQKSCFEQKRPSSCNHGLACRMLLKPSMRNLTSLLFSISIILGTWSAFAQTRYYDVTIHEAPHLIIPPNLVAPARPLPQWDFNAFNRGMESSSRAIEAISISRNLDTQTELMKRRAQLEAKQRQAEIVAASEERQRRRDYENSELGKAEREAALAEAKLRRELAEAKIAELKAKKDAEDQARRQAAQTRFEAIKTQIQEESAEANAKHKAAQGESFRAEKTK